MSENKPMFLRIVNPQTFENSKTREVKDLKWVAVPNKHDSDGYSELMDHPQGMEHYCAWILMLQVASKSGVRWLLCRGSQESAGAWQVSADGRQESAGGWRPHTARTLARVTHSRVEAFEGAIPRLKDIGWLEEVDAEAAGIEVVGSSEKERRQQSAVAPQGGGNNLPDDGKNVPLQGKTGKDREGNGSGGNGSAHTPEAGERVETSEGITHKGLTPTFEQAWAYVEKVGAFQAGTEEPYTERQVRSAWLSLEAGKSPLGQWMWGKNPLTDWRSALLSRLDSAAEKAAAKHGGSVAERIGRENALAAARRSLAGLENRQSELDAKGRIGLARLREEVARMELEVAGVGA